MAQTMGLNKMGLAPMKKFEMQEIDGGFLLQPITGADMLNAFKTVAGFGWGVINSLVA